MFRRVIAISSFSYLVSSYLHGPIKSRLQASKINNSKFLDSLDVRNLASKSIKYAKMLAVVALLSGVVVHAESNQPDSSIIDLAPENKEVFTTTQSGLQYYDTKIGEGASPLPGDTVRVHYTGWLEGFDSEKKFDSSYDRRSPLVFKVGTRQVISGWDEALLTNMKVGTIRKVIIPPNLGYGNRGAGGVIPPGATLYFTMELVGIGVR